MWKNIHYLCLLEHLVGYYFVYKTALSRNTGVSVSLPSRLRQAESCNVFSWGQFGKILLLLSLITCHQNPLKPHTAIRHLTSKTSFNVAAPIIPLQQKAPTHFPHNNCSLTYRGTFQPQEPFLRARVLYPSDSHCRKQGLNTYQGQMFYPPNRPEVWVLWRFQIVWECSAVRIAHKIFMF